jgi:glutaminyl-peptide cyclotransferase
MIRWAVVLVLLGIGCFFMVKFGFNRPDAAEGEAGGKTQFAADREGPELSKPVAFDGKRALGYLEAICDLGPRMSGSPAMKRQQELIRKHFEDLGAKVTFQPFQARQTSKGLAVEMANIIVSYQPEAQRRAILCSHYDTRPIADQETDPRKWREPFLSANDGGSGVAFLMEMANHMKDLKTSVGVDFVFFDGEEYIWDPKADRYFFGSQHFAQTWAKTKPRPTYVGAVLLDMIAGKGATFPYEGFSMQRYPTLCKEIWNIARDMNCPAFLRETGEHVQDDHISLQNAGIPAIDIIDFSYPHWHRLSDTPENCSPETMIQVAKVLSVWLQRQK